MPPKKKATPLPQQPPTSETETSAQEKPRPYLKPEERRMLSGVTLFHETTIRAWEVDDPTMRWATKVAIDAAATKLKLPLPKGRKRLCK